MPSTSCGTTPYHHTYKADRAYGCSNEARAKPVLSRHFGIDMIQQPRFAPFDFICEDVQTFVELKSRRCRVTTYPSMWINFSKVEIARAAIAAHPSRRYYFCFGLEEGHYIIPYDPLVFDGFEHHWHQRMDRDKNDPLQHVLLVPTHLLTQLPPL